MEENSQSCVQAFDAAVRLQYAGPKEGNGLYANSACAKVGGPSCHNGVTSERDNIAHRVTCCCACPSRW